MTISRSAYLPFFFTDPELVESPQTREDTPTQPSTVSAFDGVPGRMYFCL